MLKVVGINRFEGKGIIERIEGNGWDIDAERIELNGINARLIEDLENRIISLNGPAVEDLFKSLRDLLKENGKLKMDIAKLNDKLERYDSAQTITSRQNTNLIKKCDSLEKDLKEKEAIIEEKKDRIKALNREVRDNGLEIERLNNSLSNYYELYEKYHVLENKLTVADKLNPILDFISGASYDTVNFAIQTFLYFIPDYDVTVSVSRKEEKDVEIDKSEKYDGTKEILGWLRSMMENNTDYATKIFNKESKENIFSITFCKVPVEPEVVTNEQD